MFLIPAVMSMFHISLFESMGYLGAICSYGFLTVYILVFIAAPLYLRKIGKLKLQDILISAIAIGFMVLPVLGSVGVPGSDWFPVLDAPYNFFPYLFLLYLLVTCGWFMRQKRRSPGLVRSMKRSIEEIHNHFAASEAVSEAAIVPSITDQPNH